MITGAAVRPYHWTLDHYEQPITLGLLEDKHVELIQGEILPMTSMGGPHALTIMQWNYGLLPQFNPGTGFHSLYQMLPPSPAGTIMCRRDCGKAAMWLHW